MNQEAKVKWLEALRSGKYVQGKGMLETEAGCNCCLGVLVKTQGVELQPYKGTGSMLGTYINGIFYDVDVPDNYCGLHHTDTSKLISMNDSLGKSFAEIADYIEENL